MPNVKNLTRHLELSFWSLVIRLLSDSRLLRSLLPVIFSLLRNAKFQPGMRMALIFSLSGFLVGLIVGVLSVI